MKWRTPAALAAVAHKRVSSKIPLVYAVSSCPYLTKCYKNIVKEGCCRVLGLASQVEDEFGLPVARERRHCLAHSRLRCEICLYNSHSRVSKRGGGSGIKICGLLDSFVDNANEVGEILSNQELHHAAAKKAQTSKNYHGWL
jgi:hypothetical protein